MGKITVKHYLNKTSGDGGGEEFGYPVYVQVTVKRQVNRMRSQAYRYGDLTEFELRLTQKELESAIAGKLKGKVGSERIMEALKAERKIIEDVITYLNPFERDDFTIKSFADIYNLATEDIYETVNKEGRSLLRMALEDRWFGIQYIIDWEKSFDEIFDGLNLIGSSNKEFSSIVLKNKYIVAAREAYANINLFTNTNFAYSESKNDNIYRLLFYWSKNKITSRYLDFLQTQKLIEKDQATVIQELFDAITEGALLDLKMLGSEH